MLMNFSSSNNQQNGFISSFTSFCYITAIFYCFFTDTLIKKKHIWRPIPDEHEENEKTEGDVEKGIGKI